MTPNPLFQSSEQGFPVLGLRGPTAELRMVPSLGGRIISLRSLKSGREWLWHQDRPDWLWANQVGDPFGQSPQAGIDECVPTVAACRIKGRELPDHGEVWFQDWPVDPQALTRGVIRSTLSLPISPLAFTRSVGIAEDGAFVLDYALQNTGDEEEPYLWCLHPLFNIQAGDRLELPEEVQSLRLNGGLGTEIRFGDVWAYPEPFRGVRLDACEVPGMPGGCVKGFAGPLLRGYAALVHASTGDRLSLHWDPSQIPFLGIWINRGHGGFHHVGLEPTSGAPDSLADAKDLWKQYQTIAPQETLRWSIILEVY